eukprot:1159827-Pelagomonas_calceolata.AAC.19
MHVRLSPVGQSIVDDLVSKCEHAQSHFMRGHRSWPIPTHTHLSIEEWTQVSLKEQTLVLRNHHRPTC